MMVEQKVNKVRRKRNLLAFIHPERIPLANLRFSHNFGLGGISLNLILIQIVSGVVLRFHYEPNVAGAYNPILFIRDGTILGKLIRNVHHWSGVFLIVVAFLHILRVFLVRHLWKVRTSGGVILPRNIIIEDWKLVETDPLLLKTEAHHEFEVAKSAHSLTLSA